MRLTCSRATISISFAFQWQNFYVSKINAEQIFQMIEMNDRVEVENMS